MARELEDVSYTLCVMTGTSSIHDAVARADNLLAQERSAAGRAAPNGRAACPGRLIPSHRARHRPPRRAGHEPVAGAVRLPWNAER
ncbi:hypothetical protein SGRIM128S_02703 [Streptomyces griseomycini]